MQPAQTREFALDIAREFASGGAGRFLVLSDVPDSPSLGARGARGASLASTMTAAGHQWVVDAAAPITLAHLAGFDAVYCCGAIGSGAAHANVLADYVRGGGSVLLMGGSGEFGDSAAEAHAWNPFLTTFGLEFGAESLGDTTNGTLEIPAQSNGHVIARTLDAVRWRGGQAVRRAAPHQSQTQILLRGDFTAPSGPHTSILAGYNLGVAPGRIVAIGDDWLFSDHAFANDPASATDCVEAIASLFANGAAGNFLALSQVSDDPTLGARGVQGVSLRHAMTSAGHSFVVDPAAPITRNDLQQYDGVFLCGAVGSGAAHAAVLVDYVRNGGSVLLMGGSGAFGSASAEAQAWAAFLNPFGLGFGDSFFAAPGEGLLTIPTLVSGNVIGRDMTSMPWFGGQLVVNFANDPIRHIAVRGDFSTRPGPQGAFNDLIATYNAGSVDATYGPFGGGCMGSSGVVGNTAVDLPVLGESMRVVLDDVPAPGLAYFAIGLLRASPVDLAPIGAPGCVLRVRADVGEALLGVGAVTYQLRLPSLQDCLGMAIFTQAFVLDAPANSLGVIVSDAAIATIGN